MIFLLLYINSQRKVCQNVPDETHNFSNIIQFMATNVPSDLVVLWKLFSTQLGIVETCHTCTAGSFEPSSTCGKCDFTWSYSNTTPKKKKNLLFLSFDKLCEPAMADCFLLLQSDAKCWTCFNLVVGLCMTDQWFVLPIKQTSCNKNSTSSRHQLQE